MKKYFLLFVFTLLTSRLMARSYEEVKGDPMQTRIYTLDNGL